MGFPGMDEIQSIFQFCSKLLVIGRNAKNLEKVNDFVGFPGIDEIRSMWHETGKIRTTSDTYVQHKMSDYIGIRINLGVDG